MVLALLQLAAAKASPVVCPAGHAAQCETPAREKRSLPQLVQPCKPATHPWPAGQSHGWHAMAPTYEYWPELHARHIVKLCDDEYFPGTQLLHSNGLLFWHVQFAMPVCSASRPGLHRMHAVKPLSSLVDCPWLHAMHVWRLLLLEKCPGAHTMHAWAPLLPENCPGVHAVHLPVPLVLEKRPAAHTVHVAAPLVSENCPAAQAVHL